MSLYDSRNHPGCAGKKKKIMQELNKIQDYTRANSERWKDQPESYWLARLNQEVAELTLALQGEHVGPVDHELKQIASICTNWLKHHHKQD